MSKYKVGDTIKLEKVDDIDLRKGFKKGDIYNVIRIDTVNKETRIFIKDTNFVYDNQVISFDYKKSNRYKLQQAIKETGFHAEKLSLASNHAKTYFTGFTAESRFNSRGDITEERLNSLLTTLAFAEHKLLDLEPKTVDENNIPIDEEKSTMVVDGVKIEGTISDFNISFDDNSKNIFDSTEMYNKYFDEASKRNQSKRDAKVKNFLIVFIILVIILAVYFFTH